MELKDPYTHGPIIRTRDLHPSKKPRSFFEARIRYVIDAILYNLCGLPPRMITMPQFAELRDFAIEELYYFMSRVGLRTHQNMVHIYRHLKYVPNDEELAKVLDDVVNDFIYRRSIDGRLISFIGKAMKSGTGNAVKYIQEAVNKGVIDFVRVRHTVELIDPDKVDDDTPDAPENRPHQVVENWSVLTVFADSLVGQPFLDVFQLMTSKTFENREELRDLLLSGDNEAIVQRLQYAIDDLGEKYDCPQLTRKLFVPWVAMARSYQPDPEHLENPSTFLNRLNSFSYKDGRRDKMKTTFKAALAA